jgi:hypothetical protein
MLRRDTCDFGRPGGGGGGSNVDIVGVVPGDVVSIGGARFDRARTADLLGGDVLRSIADADRSGGGAKLLLGATAAFDLPGEAVCALEGGGGATGFSISALA